MFFKVSGYYCVDECLLNEMVRLCKEENFSPAAAVNNIGNSYIEENEYLLFTHAEIEIIQEIERRLNERK